MKSMYLFLEDGAVFSGRSVTEPKVAAGLVSFYTGIVGYQEMITDPANLGKLLLFTYPIIGSYGVNSEDSQSAGPKVAGVLVKEYPPYYSNFRAEESLKDYLQKHNIPLIDQLDTRAILLHLRKNGEMKGVVSTQELSPAEVKELVSTDTGRLKYEPENTPVAVEDPRLRAGVIDLGASKSFYQFLASNGVEAVILNGKTSENMDLVIVSDAPVSTVEDEKAVESVKDWIGKAPVAGFSHGAAILARACGGSVRRMGFGHHGINVPVASHLSRRREITVQNHNYELEASADLEITFHNVNDGTAEGFISKNCKAAGVTFVPDSYYFEEIIRSLEVI